LQLLRIHVIVALPIFCRTHVHGHLYMNCAAFLAHTHTPHNYVLLALSLAEGDDRMKGINAMVPNAQNAALVWNTRGQPPTASTPLVTEDWKMAPMLPSPFCVVGIQP
jgi:hypothetical protein